MEEIIGKIGIKEIEDDHPVFYTRDKRLFSKGHRIMFLDDLLKLKNSKKDIILGRWEAQFYYYFERYSHLAFTVNAFKDKFFDGDDFGFDTDDIEKILNRMVSKGIIKGIYASGYYYYHI